LFYSQYTSTDTGLIYLRARVYDPATAQFLTSDPAVPLTRAPYNYAGDNPVNASDPTGLDFLEEAGEGVAGWGDTFTFGATKWVREELGINNVNTCSTAYQAGGYAGLATAVLIPGEGEAALGAEGLTEGDRLAAAIARGHAFEKHIGEFPGLSTQRDLQQLVKDVIDNPTVSKSLSGGRTAYYDEGSNTVVITNPSASDGGTAFRPTNGLEYFNGLR
jgi:RHS repeat-associated protein